MIRRMQPADIPAAMRLKQVAGWNQTAGDWQRVLRLDPEACFVDERDGNVVGTTTAVRMGPDLGWVGMVLVLPRFRRRGIARGLLEHALSTVDTPGTPARTWGLDATDMGRPLYEQFGFRRQEAIERWVRAPRSSHAAGPRAARDRGPLGADTMAAIDFEAYGYDRSQLLADLARDPAVENIGHSSAFACGRPGSSAWFLGPCVGAEQSTAEMLIGELVARHGQDRIFWDLLPSSPHAPKIAARHGFRRVRHLTRMLLGGDRSQRCPARAGQVFAMAGFEFG